MRYCPEILCHIRRVFSSWGSRCCWEVSGSVDRFQSRKITLVIPIRRNVASVIIVPNINPDLPVKLLPCSKQGLSLVRSRKELTAREVWRMDPLWGVPHAVNFIRPINEEKSVINAQSWLIHEAFPVYRKCWTWSMLLQWKPHNRATTEEESFI